MIIDWDFVLWVAFICACVMLCVTLMILIVVTIQDAVKLHKQRVRTLKELQEKCDHLEAMCLWMRQDCDEMMVDLHNIENKIEGVEHEKNNRKISNR